MIDRMLMLRLSRFFIVLRIGIILAFRLAGSMESRAHLKCFPFELLFPG